MGRRTAQNPDTAFVDLLSKLVRTGDVARVQSAVLSGQLHLASPLRIGDLLIYVESSADDASRIDINLQNARTMGPKTLLVTVS